MNRLSLILACFALLFGNFSVIAAQIQTAPKQEGSISELDPEMAIQKRAANGVEWYDVTQWQIEGRILPQAARERWFDRLPVAAKKTVTPAVWNLSRHSTGMAVRFKTDATSIHVEYKLKSKQLDMFHMPATGCSGIDLYAKDTDGKWKWVQVTRPNSQTVKGQIVGGMKPGTREYIAYLPLYNGIDSLSFGVPTGNKFEPLVPREKPIVFYGTSITHGACASRPGMVHTSILGRWLDTPVVNLGFSGNGRMDQAVGEYLTQLDASVYVIDCLPNMGSKDVLKKCGPLVKQLRNAKPDTPIVLVEGRRNTNSWILPARNKYHDENHAALKQVYESLLAEGVKGLSYIEGDLLYGVDTEGATDGSHASDLGFMRQSKIFEPVLRAALEKAPASR